MRLIFALPLLAVVQAAMTVPLWGNMTALGEKPPKLPPLQKAYGDKLVTKEALQGLIRWENLERHLQKFQDITFAAKKPGMIPSRVAGSEAHDLTLKYIAQELHKLDYYDVSMTPVCAMVKSKLTGKPEQIWSYNLIATSHHGDPNETLLLGAHADSNSTGPGINDNGSGMAALLELAKLLARFRITNRVRFAWWTESVPGSIGTYSYTKTLQPWELDQIRLYLNIDTISLPGSMFVVRVQKHWPGSKHVGNLLLNYIENNGMKRRSFKHHRDELETNNDYRAFEWVGIPSSGLWSGWVDSNSKRFHDSMGDILDNVSKVDYMFMMGALAEAVGTYANSWGDFPMPKKRRKMGTLGRDHSEYKVDQDWRKAARRGLCKPRW